jgi:hypothetical protein
MQLVNVDGKVCFCADLSVLCAVQQVSNYHTPVSPPNQYIIGRAVLCVEFGSVFFFGGLQLAC